MPTARNLRAAEPADPRPTTQYVVAQRRSGHRLLPGEDGAVLMAPGICARSRIGHPLNDKREGYGVERDRHRKRLGSKWSSGQARASRIYQRRPRQRSGSWASGPPDATGYAADASTIIYRTKGSRDWKPLGTYNQRPTTGFNPDRGRSRSRRRLWLQAACDGRLGALQDRARRLEARDVGLRPSQVDVDGLIRIGRRQRVVGATYATDKRQGRLFRSGVWTRSAARCPRPCRACR